MAYNVRLEVTVDTEAEAKFILAELEEVVGKNNFEVQDTEIEEV
jgi:hypothetical protein